MTDWPWDQYHLLILDDYPHLREYYTKENIETFVTENEERGIHIVKDFPKQAHENVSFQVPNYVETKVTPEVNLLRFIAGHPKE